MAEYCPLSKKKKRHKCRRLYVLYNFKGKYSETSIKEQEQRRHIWNRGRQTNSGRQGFSEGEKKMTRPSEMAKTSYCVKRSTTKQRQQ